MKNYHVCGGTILSAGCGDQAHSYCDRCGAFTYTGDVPEGSDRAANRAAWDAGDDRSPEPSAAQAARMSDTIGT